MVVVGENKAPHQITLGASRVYTQPTSLAKAPIFSNLKNWE